MLGLAKNFWFSERYSFPRCVFLCVLVFRLAASKPRCLLLYRLHENKKTVHECVFCRPSSPLSQLEVSLISVSRALPLSLL